MRKLFTTIIFALGVAVFTNTVAVAQSFNEQRFEIGTGMGKLTVYPTPASHTVNISIPVALREQTDRIQIMDITGKVVLEQKLWNKNVESVSFNNLSNLANGVYIVAARDQEGKLVQSSKLIINK